MISNKNPQLDDRLNRIWQESAERLKKIQAAKANLQYIQLVKSPIELDALKLIPKKESEKIEGVVFERKGSVLGVAVFDSRKKEVLELLERLKKDGYQTKLFLTSRESLEYARKFYDFVPKERRAVTSRVDVEAQKVLELEKRLTDLAKVREYVESLQLKSGTPGEFVEGVLAGALTNRASDVHFEPGETEVKVRYRIDGSLRDFGASFGKEEYKNILSRIKLLSNLRLNITKTSQDGRFTISMGDLQIEIRASVIPSEFGETIVLRILDPRVISLSVSDLGMRLDDLEIADRQLKSPNGMILNTGPTGSGKTTTLYAFLKKVSNKENKVITIEDPIEYHLTGIEQTQVNEKEGYTFSNGLQAIMRQDPDVILVGEIRDKSTVSIAVQAALTGHLVFSTLHTNSAAGAIPRLLDLGAPPTSIGPALNLIIAQRLVRKLCLDCRKEKELNEDQKKEVEKFLSSLPARVDKKQYETPRIFEAKAEGDSFGCAKCQFSGYTGRVGIFELLEVDEELESLINEKVSEAQLLKLARDKKQFVSLQQDGVLKVLLGLTSAKEVESVTGPLPFSI